MKSIQKTMHIVLSELIEALGCWKWWKKQTPVNLMALNHILLMILETGHVSVDEMLAERKFSMIRYNTFSDPVTLNTDAVDADQLKTAYQENIRSFSELCCSQLRQVHSNELDNTDAVLCSIASEIYNILNMFGFDISEESLREQFSPVVDEEESTVAHTLTISDSELETLVRRQDELNSVINPDWRNAGYLFDIAFYMEYEEFWEHIADGNNEAAMMEAVDQLHFLISAIVEVDAPMATSAKLFNDLLNPTQAFSSSNHATTMSAVVGFANNGRIATMMLKWRECLDALSVTDITAILTMYSVKSALNHTRQQCGYKTGEYIKSFTVRDMMYWESVLNEQFNINLDEYFTFGDTVKDPDGNEFLLEDNDIALMAERYYDEYHSTKGGQSTLEELIGFLTTFCTSVQTVMQSRV